MRARAVRAAAWGGESWPRAIEGLDPPIFMSTWPLAVLLLSLLVESRAFGPVHRTPPVCFVLLVSFVHSRRSSVAERAHAA